MLEVQSKLNFQLTGTNNRDSRRRGLSEGKRLQHEQAHMEMGSKAMELFKVCLKMLELWISCCDYSLMPKQ